MKIPQAKAVKKLIISPTKLQHIKLVSKNEDYTKASLKTECFYWELSGQVMVAVCSSLLFSLMEEVGFYYFSTKATSEVYTG